MCPLRSLMSTVKMENQNKSFLSTPLEDMDEDTLFNVEIEM